MAITYLYMRKMRIWNGFLEGRQYEYFDDFIVGDRRDELDVSMPFFESGELRVTWTPTKPAHILTDVEWKLLIVDKDWNVRREGPVVRCTTRAKWSVNKIYISDRDNEDGFLYFGVELKFTNTIPTIGDINDFPPDAMTISLGNNMQRCLHIPEPVFRDFPAYLKTGLAANRHIHIPFYDEKYLETFATLDTDHTGMVRMIKQHCHEEMIRRLTVHISFRSQHLEAGSPLTFLSKNFLSMRRVWSEKDYDRLNSSNIWLNTKCETINFEISEDVDLSWLDAIKQNRCIVTKDKWILGFTSTIYNKVTYFGVSLTATTDEFFFDYHFTLELTGFIEKDDRKCKRQKCLTRTFNLSPHGPNEQCTYSTPVMCPMAELERIGMGHENATVVLKLTNKRRQNQSSNFVNFLGIKNYTIVSGDKRIRLSREVLHANSDYFAALDTGFMESNRKKVTLEGDDPDALILLFQIVYGSGAPLTYKLLGTLLILADKYAFVDVLRYLDAFLADLAKESRLPQPWVDKIEEITKFIKLEELKDFLDRSGPFRSSLTPEESHNELLHQLGISLPGDANVEVVEEIVPVARRTRKRRRAD